MEVKAYIESGVLEEYCMGLLNEQEQADLVQMAMLYPEVKTELKAVEVAFEQLAELTAVAPRSTVKQNIMAAIDAKETNMLDLNALPVISEPGDADLWLTALSHLIPAEDTGDFICHVVREDKIARQMLVISKMDVPEEDHDDFLESFFILKGRCECTIGDKFYALGAGDFIEIPLNVKHDIKLVTPVVTAILQYRFV